MTFGQWLQLKRIAAKMKQPELAERTGLSVSYISALERDEPNARDGSPRRPRVEKVDKIARALGVPLAEARDAAGYATADLPRPKPQTLAELIHRLEEMGLDGIVFHDEARLRDATPEEFQEIITAVTLAVNITLGRKDYSNAPHESSAVDTIHRTQG